MSTIGERIRQKRLALGLTQPQLAAQVGISASYMTKIEKDQSLPTPERLFALADFLELDSESLLADLEHSKQLGFRKIFRVRAARVRNIRDGSPLESERPIKTSDSAERLSQEIRADSELLAAVADLRLAMMDPDLRETVRKTLEIFAQRARPKS